MITKREQLYKKEVALRLFIIEEKVYFLNEETGKKHYEIAYSVHGGSDEHGFATSKWTSQDQIEQARWDAKSDNAADAWREVAAELHNISKMIHPSSS